jgi:putative CRISPR-associated protein (TIGR02619 family)
MRHTLICTAGTSLIGHITRSDATLQRAYKNQDWKQIVQILLTQNGSDRTCGAEINSITSICKSNRLGDRLNLRFLVSDTDDGRHIGQILKHYYEHSQNPFPFQTVDVHVLEGLNDANIHDFRQKGLKNLVREISQLARTYSPEAIAINATGGYKAQISFAGMIGQALGIPVYYLFERFSEIIELPPQPVALDLAFWLNHYLLFSRLEAEEIISAATLDLDLNNECLSALLEQDNEQEMIALSAMGYLFNERSHLQFAKQKTTILSLIPQTHLPPQKKSIHLSNHHGKDKLHTLAKRLCHSPYVVSVPHSLSFRPTQSQPIRKIYPDGRIELTLTDTDAGYGLCVQTTGRNQSETTAIALHLQAQL